MGNETGMALADALRVNASLRSFTLDAWSTHMRNETGMALAEALQVNTSLQLCDTLAFPGLEQHELPRNQDILMRNRDLHLQCRALALLARCSRDSGFHDLT